MPPRQTGAGSRQAVLSPDVEVPNTPQAQRADDFTYAMLSDLKSGQALATQAIQQLKETIEAQSKKVDKIDDLRVDIGKLSKDVEHLQRDLSDTVKKLDTVRNWIAGAIAIVAVVAIAAPILAPRIWPLPAPPAPGAPNGNNPPPRGSTR